MEEDYGYLFEDPDPICIDEEWLAKIRSYVSVVDPDFVLPWNED